MLFSLESINFMASILAVLAIPTGLILYVWVAPYGRHLPAPLGARLSTMWTIFESPAIIIMALFLPIILSRGGPMMGVLAVLWLIHYVNRCLIYPVTVARPGSRFGIWTSIAAFVFVIINTFLVAATLAFNPQDPPLMAFIVGLVFFAVGMTINVHADLSMARQRDASPEQYIQPKGRLFDLVVCPNYLGEVVQWIGFAVAAWSIAPAAFALWTFANLLPRAIAHKTWYLQIFMDFPVTRKALIPKVI